MYTEGFGYDGIYSDWRLASPLSRWRIWGIQLRQFHYHDANEGPPFLIRIIKKINFYLFFEYIQLYQQYLFSH